MGIDVSMEDVKPKEFFPINNTTIEEKANTINEVSYGTLYKKIKDIANKLLPPEDMKLISRIHGLTAANKAIVTAMIETMIEQQKAPSEDGEDFSGK
jgi:hypothetical protein